MAWNGVLFLCGACVRLLWSHIRKSDPQNDRTANSTTSSSLWRQYGQVSTQWTLPALMLSFLTSASSFCNLIALSAYQFADSQGDSKTALRFFLFGNESVYIVSCWHVLACMFVTLTRLRLPLD